MAKTPSITRRAALRAIPAITAAVAAPAAATAISPALSKVYRDGAVSIDDQLSALVTQFKTDAMAIDPSIKGAWVGRDMTIEGRTAAVMQIFLERDSNPFVQRRRKPATI